MDVTDCNDWWTFGCSRKDIRSGLFTFCLYFFFCVLVLLTFFSFFLEHSKDHRSCCIFESNVCNHHRRSNNDNVVLRYPIFSCCSTTIAHTIAFTSTSTFTPSHPNKPICKYPTSGSSRQSIFWRNNNGYI